MFVLSVVEMWLHNASEHGWPNVTLAVLCGALLYRIAQPFLPDFNYEEFNKETAAEEESAALLERTSSGGMTQKERAGKNGGTTQKRLDGGSVTAAAVDSTAGSGSVAVQNGSPAKAVKYVLFRQSKETHSYTYVYYKALLNLCLATCHSQHHFFCLQANQVTIRRTPASRFPHGLYYDPPQSSRRLRSRFLRIHRLWPHHGSRHRDAQHP